MPTKVLCRLPTRRVTNDLGEPQIPIQTSVLNRFADVFGPDGIVK